MSESLSTENERTREWMIPVRGNTWIVNVVTAAKIKEMCSELDSVEDAWGMCDEAEETIYLNEELLNKPTKFLRKILFHEITHARLDLLDRSETYNAEVLADVLGADEWEIACYVTANLPADWR
jgi:predicted metal-dependent peptidase